MQEHDSAGHGEQEHATHGDGTKADHSKHEGGRHEGHSVADFRRRFWICLAVTVPVILISPGLPFVPDGRIVNIPGADWILLALSTFLYIYGGMPFLKGFVRELRDRKPGMMTLVAVAISVAYFYSAATVFGLEGMPFFWELATLIDIMLLGHWIEMRSVGEASKALESLAKQKETAGAAVITTVLFDDNYELFLHVQLLLCCFERFQFLRWFCPLHSVALCCP